MRRIFSRGPVPVKRTNPVASRPGRSCRPRKVEYGTACMSADPARQPVYSTRCGNNTGHQPPIGIPVFHAHWRKAAGGCGRKPPGTLRSGPEAFSAARAGRRRSPARSRPRPGSSAAAPGCRAAPAASPATCHRTATALRPRRPRTAGPPSPAAGIPA